MHRVLPSGVLALLLAAGCRSGIPADECSRRWAEETPAAAPPVAAREEVRVVAMATASAPQDAPPKCCPGRPASAAPVAVAVEPEEAGVLAPLGSAMAIDCRGLGSGVEVEVLPVEVLAADAAGGKTAVSCTVRLSRMGGGAIGAGTATRRVAKGPAVEAAGIWTTGPGVAWTGNVPAGETVYLHFAPPEGERSAPYGWYVDLSAAPAGDGRVRLRVDGSAPI